LNRAVSCNPSSPVYFAIAFSVAAEVLNLTATRRRREARAAPSGD